MGTHQPLKRVEIYYTAGIAESYDADRKSSWMRRIKWACESKALTEALKPVPAGASILDAPCGTGRFFPILGERFHFSGCDSSFDMIRAVPIELKQSAANVAVARIGALPYRDREFDYVVCMRFFNLIPNSEVFSLFSDLCRVARKGVIVQVRFKSPLVDTLHLAYRWARTTRKKMTPFRGKPSSSLKPVPHPRQFTELPMQGDFRAMVKSIGFSLTRTIPVVSPLDSQKLCFISRIS